MREFLSPCQEESEMGITQLEKNANPSHPNQVKYVAGETLQCPRQFVLTLGLFGFTSSALRAQAPHVVLTINQLVKVEVYLGQSSCRSRREALHVEGYSFSFTHPFRPIHLSID